MGAAGRAEGIEAETEVAGAEMEQEALGGEEDADTEATDTARAVGKDEPRATVFMGGA